MPIIVDEVVISIEVTNRTSGDASHASSGTGEQEAIIAECVERVLDILSRKEER